MRSFRILMLSVAATLTVDAQSIYKVTRIQPPPGCNQVLATALNNSGQLVGQVYNDSGGRFADVG